MDSKDAVITQKREMARKYAELVRLRQYCLTKFGKAPEIPTPEELGLDPEDVDFGPMLS